LTADTSVTAIFSICFTWWWLLILFV